MKRFTLEEAGRALSTVRPVVERMVAERQELERLRDQLAAARAPVAGNGHALDTGRAEALEAQVHASGERLGRHVAELEALGVQVKDLALGLVDFPARHPVSGETVLLCWHLGEAEIGYWHGLEEGFAGRKPLPF